MFSQNFKNVFGEMLSPSGCDLFSARLKNGYLKFNKCNVSFDDLFKFKLTDNIPVSDVSELPSKELVDGIPFICVGIASAWFRVGVLGCNLNATKFYDYLDGFEILEDHHTAEMEKVLDDAIYMVGSFPSLDWGLSHQEIAWVELLMSIAYKNPSSLFTILSDFCHLISVCFDILYGGDGAKNHGKVAMALRGFSMSANADGKYSTEAVGLFKNMQMRAPFIEFTTKGADDEVAKKSTHVTNMNMLGMHFLVLAFDRFIRLSNLSASNVEWINKTYLKSINKENFGPDWKRVLSRQSKTVGGGIYNGITTDELGIDKYRGIAKYIMSSASDLTYSTLPIQYILPIHCDINHLTQDAGYRSTPVVTEVQTVESKSDDSAELKRLREKLATQTSELEALNSELRTLKNNNATLTTENGSLHIQLDNAKAQSDKYLQDYNIVQAELDSLIEEDAEEEAETTETTAPVIEIAEMVGYLNQFNLVLVIAKDSVVHKLRLLGLNAKVLKQSDTHSTPIKADMVVCCWRMAQHKIQRLAESQYKDVHCCYVPSNTAEGVIKKAYNELKKLRG